MKILQLIPTLNSGGAERFTVDLCNALSDKGHEVYLYTLRRETNNYIYKADLSKKVNVGYLNMKSWISLSTLLKLYKLVQSIRPDIIHTHGRALYYIMLLKFLWRRWKVIHTVHNSADRSLHKPIEHKMHRYFFTNRKIRPVLISIEAAANFRKCYPGAHYSMISNGRSKPSKSTLISEVLEEINGFRIDKHTKVFINIARLSPPKNHYLLVQAFHRLIDDNANAVLIIIGRDIPSHKESIDIKNFVLKYCGEQIRWIGEKINATDYLYYGDYFCLSSKSEAMPISLLEAVSVKCVPVCTPVGAMPVIVKEQVDGFISTSLSVESYYEALKRAYESSEEKLDEIRGNLEKKYREEFSMDACSSSYENIYRELAMNKFEKNN